MYSAGRGAAIVKVGLAVIIVATVLFWLVDLLVGPFYSLSTKTWPPELRGNKLIGGIEGAVKEVDSATSIVRVASGFLGLASLPLVISPETIIAVKGKLGSFADLDRRQLVRVAYEILPDRLFATRVDVLDRGSQPSDAVVSVETDNDATVNEAESARAPAPKPVAAPAVTPPRPPARSATTSSPRWASPIAVPQNGPTTAPATKLPMPSPASPPRTPAQDTPRPVPVTAAAAPAPSTPCAPQAGDDALPTETEPPHLPEQAP